MIKSNETPRRLTLEEMVEIGLLPPSKKKETESAENAPQLDTGETAENVTPVESSYSVPTEEIQDNLMTRYTDRASLAVAFVSNIISDAGMEYDPDVVVNYAFDLADAIQERTNHDFIRATIEREANNFKVKANKE